MELLHFGKSFPLSGLLLLAGDIESNPGPHYDGCLKFFHWNLNSICAREGIKTSLIEAYNSLHKFDVFAVTETMLDSSMSDEDIFIAGFSKEVYRSDHPSDTKVGGVCLYFRENLSIKRRTDLELLQEMVVSEIHIERTKIILVAIYRSPSQNNEQFENFCAVRFSNTYFQNVLSEWHSLDNNIKESETISEFKRKLLAVIRPKQRSVYSVYDRVGIKNLTKLRLKFSPLNEHRFRHHFDCFSPR